MVQRRAARARRSRRTAAARAPKSCEPRHLGQRLALVGRQRQRAGCAWRPGLDGVMRPCASSTMTPAVRLSRMVCRLARAALTWPMLCSTAARASASCCVMSAKERVRPPSSSLPCSAGLGERSPPPPRARRRPAAAAAARAGCPGYGQQHGAEHRQEQAERERADVHAAQALARQRPLLVLAVGLLHRDARWPPASAAASAVACRKRGSASRPRLGCGTTASALMRALLRGVPPGRPGLRPGEGPLGAHGAQLLRRRPLGVELEARLPGAGDQLARCAPQHHVVAPQLVAHAFQHQAGRGVGRFGQLGGGGARLVGEVVGQRVQRRAAQVEAGVERAFHLHVEPALDERETNW